MNRVDQSSSTFTIAALKVRHSHPASHQSVRRPATGLHRGRRRGRRGHRGRRGRRARRRGEVIRGGALVARRRSGAVVVALQEGRAERGGGDRGRVAALAVALPVAAARRRVPVQRLKALKSQSISCHIPFLSLTMWITQDCFLIHFISPERRTRRCRSSEEGWRRQSTWDSRRRRPRGGPRR